ncbi:MAG: histidine--tRNA ligase [Anaerolineae bacterium]|nr:histidine--tRNA ligase [Anaerolineae bacterium]
MTKIEARTAKGMRDFLPADMLKREYVIGIVEEVFQLYGYEPLQTPILETSETLLGKYGEEAENLIYSAKHGRQRDSKVAMRYDLTVPLARVVAQYENQLTLPFKRYQIAPVFRGENPQRGRFREFYQCDADIVGVANMSADAELVSLVVTVVRRLGFDKFTVKINNRKLLTGMGQYSGVPDDQLADLYRSVDKFDKMGAKGVAAELKERGIADDVIERMLTLLQTKGEGIESLDSVEEVMGNFPIAVEAINELREMAENLKMLNVPSENYQFDFTVVRGLGYYTGPIFETVLDDGSIGSISGGGRYDDLIGIFRKNSLPTTGVSLGIERIITIMDEKNMYPANIGGTVVDVLVTVFNKEMQGASSALAQGLRNAGIRAELYMTDSRLKLGKQFNYADKKGIPIVAVMGPDEAEKSIVRLKQLSTGEEITLAQSDAAAKIREMLN